MIKNKHLKHAELYSVLKVSEGGMGQRMALLLLKEAGIECEADYSPYVGQSGLLVYGGKRVQDRASRILYGR